MRLTSWFASSLLVLLAFGSSTPAQQDAVVINEIHYNPDVKTESVEFVELYNAGGNEVNLAGWYFSDGINYTFPATNMLPGAYVVVAQNPTSLAMKWPGTPALGPFAPDRSSQLSRQGETIRLRNAAGKLVDEVDYKLGFPWPTVGEPPGYSIELIHPGLDNSLGGSWRASVASAVVTQQTTVLIQTNASWKYFKGLSEASSPTTAWRQLNFDDSGWLTGSTPIGYNDTANETPLNTILADMKSAYTCVFFRKTFEVENATAVTSLLLDALLDDGFKVWINGVNVLNENMSTGEVPYNGTAILAIENNNFSLFTINSPPLVEGVNIIAVQAANSGLTNSSDFFLDLKLRSQTGPSNRGPTPGRINSVYATNAPPQIRQVEHNPEQPISTQPVVITAKVTDPNGVASVNLQYQVVLPGQYIELGDVAYGTSWVTVPMLDLGAGADTVAGDDVFSAEIPASVQVHRRLVRYRIAATDTMGATIRVPYADDPQPNFAYFVYDGAPEWRGAVQPGGAGSNGVVMTVGTNAMNRLPIYHLIGKSNTIATATWFSRYGGDAYQWIGTLVYDGKVYDHIHYRARGGVWRYSMVKNMWKFDLNRGHDFEARDNWGRKFKTSWTKLNLGACIQQGDFDNRGEQGMYESVSFRLFEKAGVVSPQSSFVQFRVIDDPAEASPTSQFEGDFWGLYLALEQENGRMLDEHGLPDSNFYKMEGGTGELNNLGPNGPTDKSDLNYILNNYASANDAWWRTNWNLAKYYSYQAIVQAIHHYDICYDKNFFYYFDPRTRFWELMPWDTDLTWAHNMYDVNCGGIDRLAQNFLKAVSTAGTGPNTGTSVLALSGVRPVFELEFRNRVREIRELLFNSDQAWKMIDEHAGLLRGDTNAPGILEADRCQWDYNPKMINSTYTPNLNKAGQGRFYAFPRQSATNASLRGSFAATVAIMKHYVGIRGAYLDTLAADVQIPSRPSLISTGSTNYPINRLTFRCSSYSGVNAFAAMRWRVGEVTDITSPNYNPNEPWKYEMDSAWESGSLSNQILELTIPGDSLRIGNRYRVRVQYIDVTGRQSMWSLPVEFTCGPNANTADLINSLRITELMYNPPRGGYEYIELHNSSPSLALDLGGVTFTDGIDFTFPPGTTLMPGAYLLVVGTADFAAFRTFYGLDTAVPLYGPFAKSLDNAGEQLTLRTGFGGETIVSFTYDDGRGWPLPTDGSGHSLVLLDSAEFGQGTGAGEWGGNWRASTYLKGSPGRQDPVAPQSLVINEVAAHTDYLAEWDSNDWIELYNPTETAITLGQGWYLSDDGTNLTKWMIPSNTVVPAKGWISFDEQTGFHNPTNTGFGLSKQGEQVFLSFIAGTAQDAVIDSVSFKAQENGFTWGRYPDAAGFWDVLSPTRNASNTAPVAHLVINELLYHPPDIGGTNDNAWDEFIELFNPTGSTIELFNTNGTWQLSGDIDLTFPTNLALLPGGYLLAVNFDPLANPSQLAGFCALYGLTDTNLLLVGPYLHKLPNSSGRVALEKPEAPDLAGQAVSWALVDEVIYADQMPWPCGTDGTGNSVQRVSPAKHGSDPSNWTGDAPTPGAPRPDLPVGLPTITGQPQDRIVAINGSASFSVSVCGVPPFSYQWQFERTNISGATDPTLVLTNVDPSKAGSYRVLVSNEGGSVFSEAGRLFVHYPPVITSQPASLTVTAYVSLAFGVAAEGSPPFQYQWWHNDLSLSGATNSTLLLTNVQKAQEGTYSVRVANAVGAVMSSDALLTVLVPATITLQPTNQFVAGGGNAQFSVQATGTGMLHYQWRYYGTNLPGATDSTLMINGAQLSDDGPYDVVVTDDIRSTVSQTAELTVLVRPVLISGPTSQTAAVGQEITLGVQATGTTPFSYRWRKNSTTYWYPGQNSLTLSNLALTNAGNYDVVVTNLAGSAPRSSVAWVTIVLPPPDQDLPAGTNVSFRALVAQGGNSTNRFSWSFNGQPLLTGTNQSSSPTTFTNQLYLTNINALHAGTYSFALTNLWGASGKFDFRLQVRGAEVVTIEQPTIHLDGSFGFLVSGPDHGSYTIQASPDLTNWSKAADLPCTNSVIPFVDGGTNSSRRFYRALWSQ